MAFPPTQRAIVHSAGLCGLILDREAATGRDGCTRWNAQALLLHNEMGEIRDVLLGVLFDSFHCSGVLCHFWWYASSNIPGEGGPDHPFKSGIWFSEKPFLRPSEGVSRARKAMHSIHSHRNSSGLNFVFVGTFFQWPGSSKAQCPLTTCPCLICLLLYFHPRVPINIRDPAVGLYLPLCSFIEF